MPCSVSLARTAMMASAPWSPSLERSPCPSPSASPRRDRFAATIGATARATVFFALGWPESLAVAAGGNWWLFLGGFVVAGWMARSVAIGARSQASQILALGAFVLAQAVILAPMLFIAWMYYPGAIQSAVLVTTLGFTGLTLVAFWSRKDFSFLRAILRFGGIGALVLIVASLIFGLQLGVFFSVAMIFLAGASVLYDTSNVLHHYPADKHIAASLELFSSLALMFWYVLRLFMSRD